MAYNVQLIVYGASTACIRRNDQKRETERDRHSVEAEIVSETESERERKRVRGEGDSEDQNKAVYARGFTCRYNR